jgi:hypothetical protein
MLTIYEKAQIALKEIVQIQTNEIFKRKAEKLSKETYWNKVTHHGYVSPDEAEQLNGWITLLQEFLDAKKIKTNLDNEKIHIASVVDGEDQHLFITEKGTNQHVQLVIDGGTGEIRIDPSDQPPHDLVRSIQATLELKTGDFVKVTKSSLSFVQPESPNPSIKAYTSNKSDYFMLELYNSGEEDVEDITVTAKWQQPEGPQERILQDFHGENDNPTHAYPAKLNMLKKEGRAYAHIPSISVDKKIFIGIKCQGMRSGKTFEKVFELETKNQYPTS